MLEKCLPNGKWQTLARVRYAVTGNEMELALPRATLGLTASAAPRFDFKWMDNTSAEYDVLNLYANGDTAPNGRFKYRFQPGP